MKVLVFLCVFAVASTSVFSMSARKTRAIEALERLETLLNQQLLSSMVEEQDMDEVTDKEELIAALQRACNRNSGSSMAEIESLSTLADMLSRDEVTTQEAKNVIQAQGIYDIVENAPVGGVKVLPKLPPVSTKPSVVKKALEKEVEKKIEKEIEKEVIKKVIASPKLMEMLESSVVPSVTPAPTAKDLKDVIKTVDAIKKIEKLAAHPSLRVALLKVLNNQVAAQSDFEEEAEEEDYYK